MDGRGGVGSSCYQRIVGARPVMPAESKPYTVNLHWRDDILELLLACILEVHIDLVLCIFPKGSRHADASRFSRRTATFTPTPKMSPRSSMTSATLMPMRNFIRLSSGSSALPFCRAPLHINSTAHRIHHAELSQQSISGVFDDPSAVLGDLGIYERAQVILEPGVRPLSILAGQAAVASHGGQSTLDAVLPRSGHRAALRAGILYRFTRTPSQSPKIANALSVSEQAPPGPHTRLRSAARAETDSGKKPRLARTWKRIAWGHFETNEP